MSRVFHDHTTFEVHEVSQSGTLHEQRIVEARIRTQTEWRCPSCKTAWCKKGTHVGTFHTCRCGQSFWLRRGT